MDDSLTLIRRYSQNRDPEAFAQIVRRYAGLVHGTSLRVTANTHDAEDVAQECFMELAQKADSVTSSLSGWLHATATRRSLDAIRRTSARKHREDEMMDQSGQINEPTWEDAAPLVDQALEELPEELRLPLVLHYLEGKSRTEVAKGLGVDRSTASRRLDRGIEQLRDRLRKVGIVSSVALLGFLLTADAASVAVPPTLTAALGRMAMAGVGKEGAAPAAGATRGLGEAVAMKQVVVGAALLAAVTVGIWTATVRLTNEDRQPQKTPVSGSVPAAQSGGEEIDQGILGGIAGSTGAPKVDEQSGRSPFVLENGRYTMTVVFRFSDKDKDQGVDSEIDLTVKEDGGVILVDPKHPNFPIVGKLKRTAFSARLDDAEGKVSYDGKLSGDNELKGTIFGTHRDGKRTISGTFRAIKLDQGKP